MATTSMICLLALWGAPVWLSQNAPLSAHGSLDPARSLSQDQGQDPADDVAESHSRRPGSDDEARAWLENMVSAHRYDDREVRAATGWSQRELEEYQDRFQVFSDNRPDVQADDMIRVLPYPGGRHPRIGFLDGAVDPQRETKVSIFLPWDPSSYVVADFPEAIWSNLGLTYLAHTHVATIWTDQDVDLEQLEWKREAAGEFVCERSLPNGIEFGTRVRPQSDSVRFEMWLSNGTDTKLTGLRVQNCVMLKGAKGFEQQSNDNKLIRGAYAACHDPFEKRWIITAWHPLHRCWANERCPCLHSDPQFPDCEPGQTVRMQGWLSFYVGDDIEGELDRIEGLDWHQ